MNPIRKHFKPYQPSIYYSKESSISYEEIKPCVTLQDYIFCYWQLKTLKPLENNFMYRVVSDGCIDILFEQSNANMKYITGFSNKYLEYDLSKSFDYIGIRFLPAGFPALFNISADQLTNKFIPLKDIIPDLDSKLTKIENSPINLPDIAKLFNSIFKNIQSQLPLNSTLDNRFSNAMKLILESRGTINIKDLDVGISERQLRRMFNYYFGESAKTFAKIIRFQNILGAKPTSQSLKYDKIFYDEGYYDQAHFIKEFKAFYGVTPNRAFGR